MQNTIEISQHIVVPKAQHPITAFIEIAIARDIALVLGMLTAVDFHNQFQFETGKVHNEWPQRNLTAKFWTNTAGA